MPALPALVALAVSVAISVAVSIFPAIAITGGSLLAVTRFAGRWLFLELWWLVVILVWSVRLLRIVVGLRRGSSIAGELLGLETGRFGCEGGYLVSIAWDWRNRSCTAARGGLLLLLLLLVDVAVWVVACVGCGALLVPVWPPRCVAGVLLVGIGREVLVLRLRSVLSCVSYIVSW